MMIENAYYSVNPPDMQQEARPKRPPLELYVTKVGLTTMSNIEIVISKLPPAGSIVCKVPH